MEAGQTQTQQPSAQLDESSGWRPNPGDVVRGKVVGITRGWSDWHNAFYPLVTIHDDSTGRDVDVHAFHQVLSERLMEVRPKVGDLLEIAYVGQQKSRDGKRTISLYRVTSPNDDGGNVWNSLEAQGQTARRAGAQGALPGDADF